MSQAGETILRLEYAVHYHATICLQRTQRHRITMRVDLTQGQFEAWIPSPVPSKRGKTRSYTVGRTRLATVNAV